MMVLLEKQVHLQKDVGAAPVLAEGDATDMDALLALTGR
jgi:hypothetical protein